MQEFYCDDYFCGISENKYFNASIRFSKGT